MAKKHIYLVDTKLLGYYLFQRGSQVTGIFDKIAQLLFDKPKGDIYLGWDIGKSSYRLDVSPTYKGHRDVLKSKLQQSDLDALAEFNKAYINLSKFADKLPVYNLRVQGVECDDMCSIIAKQFENHPDYKVWLVTADMDWIHSVVGTNNVCIIDVYNSGSIIDHDEVVKKYGLSTRREFTILKSIMGDKSDNIKFCKNLGPIKARDLFDTIHSKYKNPSDSQIASVIEDYLHKKEQRRLQKGLLQSIEVHDDHKSCGRTTATEAFLANLSIADPFTDKSRLTPEQLEEFNKCLVRVLPDKYDYTSDLLNVLDELGSAIQFGFKAQKIFKVV